MPEALKRHAALIVLAVAVIVATLIPVLHTAWSIGDTWQGVPPSAENYYYARMQEIKDGYPFIGNPYFFEHRDELSPAFFVSDWIASIPLLLGAPIIPTILFNLFFWALINTWLFYLFFRTLGCSKRWSAAGAFLTFLTSYFDLLRPVSLQVVAPAFTLLCIASIRWLEKPLNKKRLVALALALTLSVYIYTYLTQIALVFFGLAWLFFLWKKQWKEAKALFLMGCGAGILSLPFAWYAYQQVSHPLYWETMVRIGLVNTHLPTLNAFTNLGWIMALLAFFWTILRWNSGKPHLETTHRTFQFFVLMGAAMAIVSFSNVVSGKELEIAQHITRFIAPWFVFGLVFSLNELSRTKLWPTLNIQRRIILGCLLGLSLIGLFRMATRFGVASLIRPGVGQRADGLREEQTIGPAIAWLEKNETQVKVIWIQEESPIANQIPILSKHYVLFVNPGILHILSDGEAEERYLLSKSLQPLSLEDIKREYKVYAGAGYAVHMSKTHNRRVRICQLLLLNRLGISCGEMTDPVSFKGVAYFEGLYDKLNNEIRPNLADKLAKFNVSYAVTDKVLHPEFEAAFEKEFPVAPKVYSDSRFSIYKLTK